MEELMPHIKAHEECDGKMFRCDLCGVRYLRKKDLTSHNKKKHPIKEQQPTKIIELTPDQPFILKKPMPAETESMADTKKEIQSNLMHQASAFFEFLAARKPLTIIHKKRIARESIDPTPFGTLRSIGEESFKEIEHIYYCPECTVKIDGRAMYLNHLFQVHNYIYEPHTITCKKAH